MSDWEAPNSTRDVRRGINFFGDFNRAIQAKVDIILKKETDTMRDILRFRFPLGASDGRYPRWDYSFDAPQKSKESYTHWAVKRLGMSKYRIYNDATDPYTNYAYPLALVNGIGWNRYITNGDVTTFPRLVKSNGRIFSSQMPRGLNPWFARKKTHLKNVIKAEIGDRK